MTNEQESHQGAADCRECANWDKVKDRVRIHSVFTSLMDKMEAKLKEDDFKPSTADLLKVWDAIKTMEAADGGSRGKVIQWADFPINSNA